MNRKPFFDHLRATLYAPRIDADELSGTEFILDAFAGQPLAYTAYALATTYHETAHTMQPVKEHGGPSYFFRSYDINGQRPHVARRLGNDTPGDGALFAGRGYVQLTGRSNYIKAGLKTGYPLVGNPDLAMRADIAAHILLHGMLEGWFTGRGFASYLPAKGKAHRADYRAARRIINGVDKADQIAGYALEYEAALIKGGW